MTDSGRMLRFGGLAALVFFADQASKVFVCRSLSMGEFVSLVGSVFGIRLTANTGAAFSLFASGGTLLIAITLIAIGMILYYARRVSHAHRLVLPALALQLGGALGNLVDRVRLGHVIDFIYTSFWPTFNVADVAITVGVGLLCYSLLVCPEGKAVASRVAER